MQIKGKQYTYTSFVEEMNLIVQNLQNGSIELTGSQIYMPINLKRIERLNKTLRLSHQLIHQLKHLPFKQNWILITEAWCGDSAQSLPVLAKMAEESEGKIDLKIILRDQNLNWISKYNTDGSHSIPKLVAFNEAGDELFVWGPRPKAAQEIFKNWKTNPEGKSKNEFEVDLHTWYARDKTVSIQNELFEVLNQGVRV
ncbi:MAG: thioredoxin family protein [Bacteroidia bacterium]